MASYLGMLVWSILGFGIWIIVLLIGITSYFTEIVKAAIQNTKVPNDEEIRMKNKIQMYMRGFSNFKTVIKESELL